MGALGATRINHSIGKRYQTNELVGLNFYFGTRGSEVQILSPRPSISQESTQLQHL